MPTTADVNQAAADFIADTDTADSKINGMSGTVTDRHGVETNNLEKLFESIGYLPPVPFVSGLNVTGSNFTVEYSGSKYAANPSETFPFTTTGTFNATQWLLIAGDLYNQGGVGAVNRTLDDRLKDTVSVADYGAIGDGVTNDLAAIQAVVDAGNVDIKIPAGDFNLGAGTLSLPVGVAVTFSGGKLSNGTVACDNCIFFGARGLDETITLTGTIANEDGVFFEWFTCEKATSADYDTFINTTNATFGAIPAIATTNRVIMQMLCDNRHAVRFAGGIYPFDAEITTDGEFYITGQSRSRTLLWCPNGNFLHFDAGGATYPYFREIAIECKNSVILSDAHTVNAIHGLQSTGCAFVSYEDHTFFNDDTVAGGTGNPIYGTKFLNCGVVAGTAKGCFYNWNSNSNIYDNTVDQHLYFNRQACHYKGIMKAILYNSSCRDFCNANISYSGFDYVFYADKASSLFHFAAHHCTFETNTFSFEAVAKIDAGSSNLYFRAKDNFYVGTPAETGNHYIFLCGNVNLHESDSPTAIYSNVIRNYSDQFIPYRTTLLDSGATKYRLGIAEPQNVKADGTQFGTELHNLSVTDLSHFAGLEDIYAADSANISFLEVRPTARMITSNKLSEGFGTTAARPTNNLFVGYQYFDTSLGHMIAYDGTNWVDYAGTTV